MEHTHEYITLKKTVRVSDTGFPVKETKYVCRICGEETQPT